MYHRMVFFCGCLFSLWMGRKIGWGFSRGLLYACSWIVCVALCLGWAAGVAYALRLFIIVTQTGWLLAIIGYGAGAYISIPNYRLFKEDTLPERMMPRHVFIKSVPPLAYMVASVAFVFTFSSPPSMPRMAAIFGFMVCAYLVARILGTWERRGLLNVYLWSLLVIGPIGGIRIAIFFIR